MQVDKVEWGRMQRWADITNGCGMLNADCLHGGHAGEVAERQGARRSRHLVARKVEAAEILQSRI